MSQYDPITFQAWPKTPHWYRDVTVTEKIDGTNGGIQIIPSNKVSAFDPHVRDGAIVGFDHIVFAQSRKRIITPDDDNFGFARWVHDNAESLVKDLGPGTHFGEWWGQGIQRNYGLAEKRFSLFNTSKWSGVGFVTPRLRVTPVLYQGPMEGLDLDELLADLQQYGSYARTGFLNPEGVVIYHSHANSVFKIRLEDLPPAEEPARVASIADLFPSYLKSFNIFGKAA